MPIVNMDLFVSDALQKAIDAGIVELRGGVARYAHGRKSVVEWLRPVETVQRDPEPEPQKFGLSDINTDNIKELADIKNLNLVQIGLQVVSTALIMHKLNQIQCEISAINSNILEALRSLDTIEYNQFLDFSKHVTRGIDRFSCDDFEEALRNFQNFRSDISHYLFGQKPVRLLAHFDIVASAWKYICIAEQYEVNAAMALGRDAGKIVDQYLELLSRILHFLDIREDFKKTFPNLEAQVAMKNAGKYLKPSIENFLELEDSYKLQKLCIDTYCEHKEKSVLELQK